jgi:ATP-binding cassette subfamily B protein
MTFIAIYARVLRQLRPERWLAIALAVANVVVAGLQFLEPVLFGRVIDTLTGAAGRPPDAVWADALRILGLWIVIGIVGIVASIVVSLYADRMAHRNRLTAMARYFEHVLSLPFAFHNAQHSGRLLKVMLQGVDNLFGLWLSFFREQLSTAVALFVLLPLSLVMNWQLGLLLIALIVFFAVANTRIVARTDRMQRRAEDYHSQLAGQAGDALTNVQLIQSFVRLSHEARLLHRTIGELLAVQYPVLNWWALLSVLTRAAATITVLGIFILGTWLHLGGQASVGEIVSFMGFATLMIGRMEQASYFVGRMFFQMPALADFFNVLETESIIREKLGAQELGRVKGAVEFDQVSFSYDGKRPALQDFSLKVEPGTTVALVGPTGAGKSTLAKLIARLYDPSEGSIRFGGVDLREAAQSALRERVVVVPQEGFLFNASILDNVGLARSGASPAEVERALAQIGALERFRALPEGLATIVDERGARLSAGEKQLVSLARAALVDPAVLVLDESTSSLDPGTEALVERALGRLMQGRTVIAIAHRLSTAEQADRVAVVAQGRLLELGSHRELLARGGHYAALHTTWRGGLRAAG